jgi:hypothetical protein
MAASPLLLNWVSVPKRGTFGHRNVLEKHVSHSLPAHRCMTHRERHDDVGPVQVGVDDTLSQERLESAGLGER